MKRDYIKLFLRSGYSNKPAVITVFLPPPVTEPVRIIELLFYEQNDLILQLTH